MKIISKSEGDSNFDLDFSHFKPEPYKPDILLGFLKMPFPKPLEFWIAKEGRDVLGRIGANISSEDPEVGYFGFFALEKNQVSKVVAQELLKVAAHFLKEKGAKKIYGPLNINTWFPYRFQIDAFDQKHFSWEPANPPEYVDYVREAGFKELERYHSVGSTGISELAQNFKLHHDKALAMGYSFRPFDSKNLLTKEVQILYDISMKGFSGNFLFEPIPFEVFKQLYVPLANKVDLSLSNIAIDPKGNPVGFFLIFEDQGYMVMKTVAVLPEARGKGLSNALTFLGALSAQNKGLDKVISALVKKGAQSESYSKKTLFLWKHEYALYQRDL